MRVRIRSRVCSLMSARLRKTFETVTTETLTAQPVTFAGSVYKRAKPVAALNAGIRPLWVSSTSINRDADLRGFLDLASRLGLSQNGNSRIPSGYGFGGCLQPNFDIVVKACRHQILGGHARRQVFKREPDRRAEALRALDSDRELGCAALHQIDRRGRGFERELGFFRHGQRRLADGGVGCAFAAAARNLHGLPGCVCSRSCDRHLRVRSRRYLAALQA